VPDPLPPQAPAADSKRLRFGDFELRLDDRSLWANGQRVPMGARPIAVLEMLVLNRHRAVPKDELLDKVWDRIVEENNLQVQIAALRRVLGSQAIITVPGRGYRFAEDIEDGDHAGPTPAELPPRIGNLGAPSAPILGRERERRALAELVESNPLITLSGAPGIGKTRLAEAVAQDMQDGFEDGVWMIELASMTDPRLLASAIAQTMKLALLGVQVDAEELAPALRQRRSLVVLDNAEHLVDAIGALVTLVLHDAAAVRLLVTSQEALRIPSEKVFRLSPLAVPEQGSMADPADFGAVQLFVDRARSADAAFRLHTGNIESIVEICRRLDGLPLAIELAAARVPSLGVEGVRTKLDERFRLLTAGHRMVPPRHKTLRAAMDWSYGLLTAAEAAVYRRLGLFVGTFSLAAAQDVAQDESVDAWAVIEVLSSLVDKSLVIPDGEDQPRYRLLESTREHAIDLMDRHAETDQGLVRHAQATRRALEVAIKSRREDLVLAETGNVRSAFVWAMASPDRAELAVAFATLPCMVMAVDGAVMEVTERILAVEPLVNDAMAKRLRAQFWQWRGRLCLDGRMSVQKGLESLRLAEALFTELSDERHVHACRRHQAEALLEAGDLDGVATVIGKARAMEHAKTPPSDRMRRLRIEGLLLSRRGQLDAALERLELALEMAQVVVHTDRYELLILEDLARLRFEVGGPQAAAAEYRALAERARHVPNAALTHANSLTGLIAALLMQGDLGGAVKAAHQVLRPICRAGAFLGRADTFAWLAAMCGNAALATHLVQTSKRYRSEIGIPQLNALEQTCRERALARVAEIDGARNHRTTLDADTVPPQEDLVAALLRLSPPDAGAAQAPSWT
jgi:predicted ATPase/DNA-binding winged helix-turn-helix (wHTH) protein